MTGPPVARSAARPDLNLILALATVAATATVGVWAGRTAFPLLTDEADYLGRACQRVGFESIAWGPLYAALYCALRHVSDDPFGVFWAKQAAVPLAGGALFHRLGLAYGLGPLLSPLAALWCVLALIVVNGTNEFAILLGLTACLWAVAGGRRGWTAFYALMGAAALVRPEYLVGLGAAALLRLGRRYGRGRAAAVAAVVALAAGLAVGRKSGGESRSWFAFGQQFAVNYVEAHGAGPDPYVEWRSVAARAFPTSASISDAVRENPRMVAWHLRYNLSRRLPRAAANLFVPIPSFVLWPFPLREALAAAVLVLVLVTAPAGARKLVRAPGPSLTPLLALATLPSVSLLFRPAARHLLPLLPLVVVLVGTALRIEPDEAPSRARAGRRWLFGGALLLGLVSPWAFWAHTSRPAPTLTEWIRGLRQDARSGPVRLLGTWYADRTCALVGPSCRAVSIAEFLEGQQVDAALIGPDWDARADVQSDTRLRALPSRPEDYGCAASAPPADGLRFIRCGPAGKRGPPP